MCKSIAFAKSPGIVTATEPPALRSFLVRAICYFRGHVGRHLRIASAVSIHVGHEPLLVFPAVAFRFLVSETSGPICLTLLLGAARVDRFDLARSRLRDTARRP